MFAKEAWNTHLQIQPVCSALAQNLDVKHDTGTGAVGQSTPTLWKGTAPRAGWWCTHVFHVKEWGEDRAVLYCQSTNWPTNSLHEDAESRHLDLGHGKKQSSLCFHILYCSMAAGGCCCWRDSALSPCILVSSSGRQANSTRRENQTRQINKITNTLEPKILPNQKRNPNKNPKPNPTTQHRNKRKKEGNHHHCPPWPKPSEINQIMVMKKSP